jgi:pimeloyl-ACP methyl ester carboxylesterase
MSTRRNPALPLFLLGVFSGAGALVAAAMSKIVSGPLIVGVTGIFFVTFVVMLILATRAAGPSPLRMFGRIASGLVAALAAGYLVLFVLIAFGQDVLADTSNAFFQPRRITEVAAARLAAPDVEELEIAAPDGATLRGWLVKGAPNGPSPLVIYFGGSGSESSSVIARARLLAPWSVALVNYRGFGLSSGAPAPRFAFADALLIYDTLVQRPDVDAARTVAMGYSLGTGVAVHLAQQRPVTGVVLFAPYDRLKLVNPGHSPLYAPLQPLMKPYFSSIDQAPQIRSPLFALVGARDDVFPVALSRQLADKWGGPAEVQVYDGEGHTLSEHSDSAWLDVRLFLSTLQPLK